MVQWSTPQRATSKTDEPLSQVGTQEEQLRNVVGSAENSRASVSGPLSTKAKPVPQLASRSSPSRFQRPYSSEWMLCRLQASGRTIIALAGTGATENLIASRLATSLKLKVHPWQGALCLAGNKTLSAYGVANLEIRHNDFCASIWVLVAHIQRDLILGQPFWKTYRVVPDYARGGIIIRENEKRWHLGLKSPPVDMSTGEQMQAATRGKEQTKSVTCSTKPLREHTLTSAMSAMSTSPSYLSPTQSSRARSHAVKHKDTEASLQPLSPPQQSVDSTVE
ncbi:hypothetical protein EDD37DRAFT_682598 [Exophiala viscosa]|uniref:uncharacterized protein n=1 Tax=Exophiala viscosa TaxID=2486360 RepID=UPI002199229D|nr:hypothetical protein EDD37DRAFT_682598 [Exophiala viscosa]